MLDVSQEKILYHALRKKIDFYNLTSPEYFNNNDIKTVFRLDKEFTLKYKNVPTKQQIFQIINQRNIKEITESKMDSIFDLDLNEYDNNWVDETIEFWLEYQTLITSVVDLSDYIQTTKVDSSNIKKFVQTAKDLIATRNNINLDFDLGLDFFDTNSHKQLLNDTFSSGYSFVDQCLGGGLQRKTLIVFAGKSKIGKSIWLSNLAVNAVRSGINTSYVSFELRDRGVIKRLGSNLLNIPISTYYSYAEQELNIKRKLETINLDALTAVPGKLIVKEYPASTIGVPDVERYLQKLEEAKGEKFELIVIDYINLMQDWRNPNSDSTYLKIKRIAEDLRAMATRNNWCIVTVTQVNRAAVNSSDLTIESISESMGIAHTADAVFGIMQDEMQKLENTYILKALALRDATTSEDRKHFHIDYEHMRITERMETGTYSNNSDSNFEDLTR